MNDRGLTIPKHIKEYLPDTLIEMLENDGHGISFPYDNVVQMRYIKDGKDLGGTYRLSKYGSWVKTLRAAYWRNEFLRDEYPNSAYAPDPKKGVRLATRYRDKHGDEYSFQVSYKKDGKATLRSFYFGNENTASTERKKHAEKTAWHFRRKYCETLDPETLSLENIKGWQHTKFY